jgi:hypothetical protein
VGYALHQSISPLHHPRCKGVQWRASQSRESGLGTRDLQGRAIPRNTSNLTRNKQVSGSSPLVGSPSLTDKGQHSKGLQGSVVVVVSRRLTLAHSQCTGSPATTLRLLGASLQGPLLLYRGSSDRRGARSRVARPRRNRTRRTAGGWLITVVVFGRLPTTSCFQNHTGGVQEMVSSLIIPLLLIHYASSSHIRPSRSSGCSAASLMVMRSVAGSAPFTLRLYVRCS